MRKGKAGIWAAILAAVPLAGLCWKVYTHFADQKPPAPPAVRWILFSSDDLADLVTLKKQTQLFADLPISNPFLIQSPMFGALTKAFSPSQIAVKGRTVDTAIFLSVTNMGDQQSSKITFHSQETIPDFEHLGKDESALLCVELDYLNGQTIKLPPIDEIVVLYGDGKKSSVHVEPMPDRSAMASIPGKRPGVRLGYPKAD